MSTIQRECRCKFLISQLPPLFLNLPIFNVRRSFFLAADFRHLRFSADQGACDIHQLAVKIQIVKRAATVICRRSFCFKAGFIQSPLLVWYEPKKRACLLSIFSNILQTDLTFIYPV